MIILLKLILAHLIGDFLLQPGSWVRKKERNKIKAPELYLHVFIHGALVLLLLWDLKLWLLAIIVALVHFLIDVLKIYNQRNEHKTKWFLIDQGLHIVSLVVIYIFWFQPKWEMLSLKGSTAFWILITSLLFVTVVTGIIIQMLMRKWAEELKDRSNQSLHDAGTYIGILERLLVFTFIFIGHWEAIGFLLAAKSIFRFGDLKEARDRKLTEYILIGTLMSFAFAIATALIARQLASMG